MLDATIQSLTGASAIISVGSVGSVKEAATAACLPSVNTIETAIDLDFLVGATAVDTSSPAELDALSADLKLVEQYFVAVYNSR